ncbi:MAG: lipopolysaccharide biosynthesis protein [Acutalibacteraceae bacterium]
MIKKFINKYHNMSKVAKAALWFAFATVLQKGISFLTVPIFTRIMDPAQYGLFNVYLSWISVLTIIGGLEFHTCIYINELTRMTNEKDKEELAVSLLDLSFIITSVLFIIYCIAHEPINQFLGMNTMMVMLMFLEVLFIPAVNLWSTKQRFTYHYKKLVAWTIGQVTLNVVLGIVFVHISSKENQAFARVLSIAVVQIVFGIILICWFIVRAKKVFSTKYWKKALILHLPLLPHKLSLTVLSSADRIMIDKMIDSTATALYSVAYSASMVINLIKLSMNEALTPWIYECIKNKNFDSLRKNTVFIMLMVIGMAFIFILFAPEIIWIVGSEKYMDAIYTIPPVAASVFFTFLYNLFSSVEFYFEKTKEIMYASIVAAVLNVLLNLVCIYFWGYIAAGYTTLVCYIVLSITHYIVMKKTVAENIDEHVELFDKKIIIILSAIVVISTILFSISYSFIYIRYSLILGILITILFKRKRIINTFKEIKKK